jgi:hypothetical protein
MSVAMAGKTPLSERKHLVRCKRAADRLDGWHERAESRMISCFLEADCVRSTPIPEPLKPFFSSKEWIRFLAAQLYGNHRFERSAAVLSETLPGGEPPDTVEPPSVTKAIFAASGIRNFPVREKLWRRTCLCRLQKSLGYFLSVLFQLGREHADRKHVFVESVPRDSGPVQGEFPRHRLCSFLKDQIEALLPGVAPIHLCSKSWEAGVSRDGRMIVSADSFRLPPLGLRGRFDFIGQALRALGWALASARSSDGLAWFVLPEVLCALHVKCARPGVLPKFYFTTNSNLLGCRLFHLVLDSLGCRVVMLSYSTNCVSPVRKDGTGNTIDAWSLSLWPEYWCWNSAHEKWAQLIGCRRSRIVGPTPFSDSGSMLPAFSAPAVAAFEVQPYRDSHLARLGMAGLYYSAETSRGFLEGVVKAAKTRHCSVVIKRKREIGKNAHPLYRHFLRELRSDPRVIEADPEISAARIIEGGVSAVVSMPFTSTALLAAASGIPSCYFDPTASLANPQSASHGIPILQSSKDLELWLSKVVTLESNDWQQGDDRS